MARGKGPADPSPVTPPPAAERGEHWWPVALAIIAVVGMHVALPANYRVNPTWVVPLVLLGLLAALIIGDPGRIDRQKPWLRVTTSGVIALLTLANPFAAGRLVAAIITVNKVFANNALALLATGGVIWATNVSAIKRWAKLMMTKAAVSLVIGILVVARGQHLEVEAAGTPVGPRPHQISWVPGPGGLLLRRRLVLAGRP